MPERLRVLRVIARMNVGGPALQVATLAAGLDPDCFEQRLLVGHVGPGEGDYLELRAPDVEVVRIAGLGRDPRATSDVRALAAVAGEIGRFRPHIVHTHTAKAGVLGRLAARLRHVPAVVHTFHGHLLHGYFSPRVTRAVVGVERVLARMSHRLVAVGVQVRDDLLRAGIGRPEQYVVIPAGVAVPPVARDEARRRLDLPLDAPVVAFVGRLTAVKRPDRFAEAAVAVARTVPDVVVVVAGEGELLEETRSALGSLGDRARFLGWRSDVENVYGAADLVLLTSDNEGMPVSLMEAAAAGCPAITTDVGSASEVVLDGRTGIVTGRDAGALARAAADLLTNRSEREAMAAAAREWAAERFSPERLIADHARLYEELANEQGVLP